MKKILQQKEKVLRKVAKEVPISDIKTAKTRKVLKEMSQSLASQSDGVAIAAPQIGYSLRIFVVSGKIFEEGFADQRLRSASARGQSEFSSQENRGAEPSNPSIKDLIFINPKISKLSRQKEWLPEGCLSVRPLYGKTHRSKKATVTAYDENGKKFTRGASGLMAQIFQHETDHLNGILFIDHAKEIVAEEPQNSL
ncbi:MAG: peptide deformylase [Candidatus Paceibacterota bacterium]